MIKKGCFSDTMKLHLYSDRPESGLSDQLITNQNITAMTKGLVTKKTQKKEPTKSLKEKRKEKKEKKNTK